MRILLGEQPRCALRQIEQARARFEVILICRLMQADLAQAVILLRAHVVRELLEKMPVDPPVQLVDVDGVDAVLETLVFARSRAIAASCSFFSSAWLSRSPAVLACSSSCFSDGVPEAYHANRCRTTGAVSGSGAMMRLPSGPCTSSTA